jgi:hypothetical protein
MAKKSLMSAMAVVGGLLLAVSMPTAAQAATMQLGNITCGQAWGPYAHILSDSAGSTISHVHRRSATVSNTFTYSNPSRQVRVSSSNYTSETASYIYLSSDANLRSSSLYCDT